MTEFEDNPQQTSKVKMQSYLDFSEKFLEQLIESTAAIKDKESKILKIANYNQRLFDMLNPNQYNSKSALVREEESSIVCKRCTDLVPQLEA